MDDIDAMLRDIGKERLRSEAQEKLADCRVFFVLCMSESGNCCRTVSDTKQDAYDLVCKLRTEADRLEKIYNV